jgi:hypothetical protein
MALVTLAGKTGFFDTNGNLKIPIIYDEAWPFANGKTWVKKDSDWFYVDKTGACVEDCP